ncbi:MAG TPA: hypothetical protein VHR45_10425 [Thermoanaerobaculia bacterium]|nr:hypothetical protein [Thermoanaerobaculia bacterium]
MKTVLLDKIASVTRSCQLEREVRLSGDIPCDEGVVVAVRVRSDKSTYNQLELPSGRMAVIKRGDVIAGALGHRQALFGYSGVLPQRLAPGDTVHLLNLGGVLGICDSVNPDLGPPFDCEVLGTVLSFPYLGERIGVAARIGSIPLDPAAPLLTRGVPVVAMVGSCMNCGKTAAACTLVRHFSHQGLTVDALKATGVALRRDVLAMEDAGARSTAMFTDLGVVATTAANAPAVARMLLNRLAAGRPEVPEVPDLIVAELGDGLLGAYGVAAILDDPAIRAAFTAVVLAANDPVAAWGGVRILREQSGIEPVAVTGPATDNLAGTRIIEERLGVPTANARTDGERLAALVRVRLGLAAPALPTASAAADTADTHAETPPSGSSAALPAVPGRPGR